MTPEIKTMRLLDHPHLVHLYDEYGYDKDGEMIVGQNQVIVMTFIDGTVLSKWAPEEIHKKTDFDKKSLFKIMLKMA
jgi:serine/threonine protein kinase